MFEQRVNREGRKKWRVTRREEKVHPNY